jgi:hypothetical protein
MTSIPGIILTAETSANAVLSQTACAKLQRSDEVLLTGRDSDYWYLSGCLSFFGLRHTGGAGLLLSISKDRAEAASFASGTLLERISPIVGPRSVRVIEVVPPPGDTTSLSPSAGIAGR